jgi:hypothetical protein
VRVVIGEVAANLVVCLVDGAAGDEDANHARSADR